MMKVGQFSKDVYHFLYTYIRLPRLDTQIVFFRQLKQNTQIAENKNTCILFRYLVFYCICHISNYGPSNIFKYFQNCAHCEKDLKDTKHNTLHLGRKCACIFILGHFLFLVAHCSLLGTGKVCGQISQHIFASNGGYCLYTCIICNMVYQQCEYINKLQT